MNDFAFVLLAGGSGTVLGPVIGALLVTALFSVVNILFPEIQPVFSGAAVILVMLFMPHGIMRLGKR